MHGITSLLATLATMFGFAESPAFIDPRTPSAIEAHSRLELARAAALRSTADADRSAILRSALEETRNSTPENVLVRAISAPVLERDSASTSELTAAATEVAEILGYRIRKEADLPEGFPTPTAVGVIRIKQYPAYRLARAQSKGDSAFLTLFAHISTNRIEMSAPVEMNTRDAGAGRSPETIDMAFLYGSQTIGKPGQKLGGVVVEDVSARTSVCMGLMGENSRRNLKSIEQRLEAWLTANAPEYIRNGSLRVMGYNSPSVPRTQNYWEVEFDVIPRPVAAAAN